MTTKFIVVTKNYDSEYGHLAGFRNIKIVDTEAEALLEVQKRMEVCVYYREPNTLWRPKTFHKHYPGAGCEIIVNSYSDYFLLKEDGTFDEPKEEYERSSTNYGGFVLGAKPIYEPHPSGSHWNHKIIGYDFEDNSDLI